MTRHARIACFALLIATALAAASFWGPWVDHPAAALQLSGQDLGEFVKFLPAIRQRERPLLRQVFYLQPLACALIYALLAGARASGFPRSVRTAALLAAPPLLLGLLPPVWGHPKDLFAREFAAQATGFLSGGILILAHGLYRRLSARTIGLAIGVLALVTALPSHWTFWSVKPLDLLVGQTADLAVVRHPHDPRGLGIVAEPLCVDRRVRRIHLAHPYSTPRVPRWCRGRAARPLIPAPKRCLASTRARGTSKKSPAPSRGSGNWRSGEIGGDQKPVMS